MVNRNTLPSVLARHASRAPEKQALVFLGAEGEPVEELAYSAVWTRAVRIAAHLREHRCAGAPVLIVARSERDFALAFLGCLLSGAIAVPLGAPEPARLLRYRSRLGAVVRDARPVALLGSEGERTFLGELGTELGAVPWISLEEAEGAGGNEAGLTLPGPEAVAWLQYTSGSTAEPKGVVVTHGNLFENERMIAEAHGGAGPGLSWLPLSHDMGLVGGLLHPLYLGTEVMLMSPVTFLRRPARWLQLLSKHRMYFSAAPSFGYDYCVRQVREHELAELDLSSWKVAFNGAEPVRAKVMDRFLERFGRLGVRRELFLPCYGLAEATLLVSGRRAPGTAARLLEVEGAVPVAGKVEVTPVPDESWREVAGRERGVLVSCGQPASGLEVLIVDARGQRAGAGEVGEIWVRGGSVARGYWSERADESATFSAQLSGEPEGGGYLRTGDLGFLHEGELFVTGRLKELVILDGRNHYPQDLEATAERASAAVVQGGVVAVACELDGAEGLLVLVEVRLGDERADSVMAQVRSAIAQEHGVSVRELVLLRRGALPRTTSGKLQRRAAAEALAAGTLEPLARFDGAAPAPAAEAREPGEPLLRFLARQVARLAGISLEQVDVTAPLASMGLGSREAVELAALVSAESGRELPATLAYEYPTLLAIAEHLSEAPAAAASAGREFSDEPIAIVGMACRLPGGIHHVEALWRLLLEKGEVLGPLPLERWARLGGEPVELAALGLEGARMGVLDDLESFDAELFGLSPREVRQLDPQHRLALEVGLEALEDAGVALPRHRPLRGGVFLGLCADDLARLVEKRLGAGELDAHTGSGSMNSAAAGRLAHLFNFRGPALVVDTACSSSLVALHLACQSLRQGECEVALVGGASVVLSPKSTAYLSRIGALSATGACRVFDEQADGYVRAEGAGVVVLRRLADAVAAGDRIWAVVRGTAVNHDGTSNGLLAPNGAAQEEVIRQALRRAEAEGPSLAYVECHGTGTPLGDPIELRALGAALGAGRREPLLVGSVKANVGHLEAAAGVIGLIKAALVAHHGVVPPQAGFCKPSQRVAWHELGLGVATSATSLPATERWLLGVSSFGLSGTNAHAVLEPAPAASPVIAEEHGAPVVCLSARTEAALSRLVADTVHRVRAPSVGSLAAYAHAAHARRTHWEVRIAAAGRNGDELAERLAAAHPRRVVERRRGVAFLFTGQGAQRAGMGRSLYRAEPVVREVLDRCEAVVREVRGASLLERMFEGSAAQLGETEWTQPALYALEVALAAQWRAWGVEPTLVLGHSVGELAAAAVAGVFSLEDGLRLALWRGTLCQRAAAGAMLAVRCSEATLLPILAGLAEAPEIAAYNGATQLVLAGGRAAVEDAARALTEAGIDSEPLRVTRAFHSRAMEEVQDELEQQVASLSLAPPRIPLVSNVTGAVAGAEVATAAYWRRHLRAPVRFAQSLQAVVAREPAALLELGPQAVLLALASERASELGALVPSLVRGRDEGLELRQAVAALYCAGVSLRSAAVGADAGHVALPSYPLERVLHPLALSQLGQRPVPSRVAELAGWMHEVTWQPRAFEDPRRADGERWVVCAELSDEQGQELASELRQELAALGAQVTVVSTEQVVEQVVAQAAHRVLWLAAPVGAPGARDWPRRIFALVRAAERLAAAGAVLIVATRGAVAVAEHERPAPVASAWWSAVRGLAHTGLRASTIDLGAEASAGALAALAVAAREAGEDRLALRGAERYVARLRSLPAPQPGAAFGAGTYVVTGGTGALGGELTRALVAGGATRVVLWARRAPAAGLLSALAAGGAEVEFALVDVADLEAVEHALAGERARGALRGVLHLAGQLVGDDAEAESLEACLRGKAIGAWNLHEATSADALEHFVLFGSASALFGAAGHSMYSAANGFLEGLAALRRAMGLPGRCLEWGPFGDKGMAAQLSQQGADLGGLEVMRSAEAMRWLPALLAPELPASVGVFRPGARMARWAAEASPFFAGWQTAVAAAVAPAVAAPKVHPWRAALAGVHGGARRQLLLDKVRAVVVEVLSLAPHAVIDPEVGLRELGMDSLMALEIRARVQAGAGLELPATLLFERPSLSGLVEALCELLEEAAPAPVVTAARATSDDRAPERAPDRAPIAIIGMGCRFPGGVTDPQSLWQLLRAGGDAVTEVPADRWDVERYYDPSGSDPARGYARWGAFLDRVDELDAEFFRVSPREAAAMDPQQRLLLEVAWEALEHAGVAPQRLRETATGVFVGIGIGDYATIRSRGHESLDPYTGTGTAFAFSSGRLSYFLGLRGPSLAVDTACSSSLVALHLACQSLRRGESKVALAGGVHLMLSPHTFVYLSKIEALSRTGRCRTFDARADGYVRGEGCGVVVLKPLEAALADGDRVLAVLRGTAVNHDGPSSGLTAPSGPAQEAVIEAALADAGLGANEVDLVECHGTATPLGDPIELRALANVAARTRTRPLLIGSVKTNLGHLEAAAGMAGLMKVVLAMQHGEVPPHLHFEEPSAHVPWSELPFEVPRTGRPWARAEAPRRAGVSAFGLSGTNAHVIVEEAPEVAIASPSTATHVLALSARTPAALRELAERFGSALVQPEAPPLDELCYTAWHGRARFEQRAVVVGGDAEELARGLSWLAAEQSAARADNVVRERAGAATSVAFLCSGQGAQVPGMGRALYDSDAVVREVLERCDEVVRAQRGESLLQVMFEGSRELLARTDWCQPALYALEVALAARWRRWGVEPQAALGHSVGELAAAQVAGVFSIEQGMALALARGELMQRYGRGGAMLAVRASEEQAAELLRSAGLEAELEVAAINGPAQLVLSGEVAAIERASAAAQGAGLRASRLEVSHAFHSRLMDEVLAPFEAAVAALGELATPRLPLISNLTGAALGDEVTTPGYWRRQLRGAVRFERGLRAAAAQGCGVFIELGPRPVLCALGLDTLGGAATFVASQRGKEDGARELHLALGELFVRGVEADPFSDRVPRKVALPTYPFERRRYWLEEAPARAVVPAESKGLPGQRVRSAGREWAYESRWSREAPCAPPLRLDGAPLVGAESWLAALVALGEGQRAQPKTIEVRELRVGEVLALGEVAGVAQVVGERAPCGEPFVVRALKLEPAPEPAPELAATADGTAAGTAAPSAAEEEESWRELWRATARWCHEPILGPALARGAAGAAAAGSQVYRELAELGLERDERSLATVTLDGETMQAQLAHELEELDEPMRRQRALAAALDALAWAEQRLGGDVAQGPALLAELAVARLALRWRDSGPLELRAQRCDGLWQVELCGALGVVVAHLEGVRVLPVWPALEDSLPPPALPVERVTWAALPARGAALGAEPMAWELRGPPGPLATALQQALRARGQQRAQAEAGGGWIYVVPALPASGPEREAALSRNARELWAFLAERLRGADSRVGWVLTEGAALGEGAGSPGAAALAALVHVAANELGGVPLHTLDVEPGADPAALAERVLEELAAASGPRLSLRGGGALAPTLEAVSLRPGARWLPRGAQLVTGGLGAIGRVLVRWLCAGGAERVVVLGRSQPDTAQARWLESLGARVCYVRGDVAQRSGVEAALRAATGGGLALRGVFHAAGVLDDGPLETLTWERIERVLGAKVSGAQLLHELTAGQPLEAFVLFSSVASVLGTPGQGSYAAANAYLDGLAEQRRAAGLPALSIAWGPWRGEGMAGRTRSSERWREFGVQLVSPRGALRVIDELLAAQRQGEASGGAYVVFPVRDRLALRPLVPACPLVRSARGAAPAAAVEHGALRRALQELPEAARERRLVEAILEEVVGLLGIEDARGLDPQRPLTEVGFDSLMAVRLRDALQASLELTLSATTSFDYPTPQGLARHLLSRLQPSTGVAPPAPPEAASEDSAEVDDMSASELLQFLDSHQVDEPAARRAKES